MFENLKNSKPPPNGHKEGLKMVELNRRGFTLVEIMITVAIIGLLAVIATPSFVRARVMTQQNTCINNMRQIDAAKHQWAVEHGKTNAAIPTPSELGVYIREGFPTCPTGGIYNIGNLETGPSCSMHGSF